MHTKDSDSLLFFKFEFWVLMSLTACFTSVTESQYCLNLSILFQMANERLSPYDW